MQNKLAYFRLHPDEPLPNISALPLFKAILVIEEEVPEMWQWEVSRWLAASGCRYMMAWGQQCSAWDDSVAEANLEASDYADMADTDRIMTTAHEEEDLSDVFWFSKHSAGHPAHVLQQTVILHVSREDGRQALEDEFAKA